MSDQEYPEEHPDDAMTPASFDPNEPSHVTAHLPRTKLGSDPTASSAPSVQSESSGQFLPSGQSGPSEQSGSSGQPGSSGQSGPSGQSGSSEPSEPSGRPFEPAPYQRPDAFSASPGLYREPHAHVGPPYYTPGTAQWQPPFYRPQDSAQYPQPGQPTPGQPTPGQPTPGQYVPEGTASYGQFAAGASSAYPYGGFEPSGPNDAGPTGPNGPTGPTGFGGTPYDSPPRRPRARMALLGTAVLAALIGGGVGAGTVAVTDNNSSSSSSGLRVSTATAQTTATTNGSVAAAAAKITPSVVTIQVAGSQESGTGSGVIIRSDGYILTNDHVVSVAASGGTITVQTSDGRSATATIVGRDTSDDLAVVKVSGLTNLTAATFAQSSSAIVGQTVVAVGAPLGLSDTVTSGIVSATARTVRSGDTDQAVFAAIQTDAAINPGNSGGALTDLNGNVLGINAAIASTTSSGVTIPGQQTTQSGSIGIGFAIPSDEASRIAAQLIATGKSTHAALGVRVQSDTSTSAATTTNSGATIASVTAGGAASGAGIKAGDVVTAVDNHRIVESDDLIAAIRAHAPKDSVKITYTRGGTSRTVTVTLGSATS